MPRRIVAIAALSAGAASAQVPATIGYQGRLLRADGTPETGVVQVILALFDTPTGGTAVACEIQQVALSDGFYSLELGRGSACAGAPPAISAAIFDGKEKYLEVGLSGIPLAPRQKVASVPYAMRAGTASRVEGGAVNATAVSATSVTVGGTTVIDSGGKVTGSQVVSTAPAGTAPLVVTSTTVVPNLNADLVNGVRLTGLAGFRCAAGTYMVGFDLNAGTQALTPVCSSSRGTQANPGSSCKDILTVGGSIGDGLYWVDPNGGSTADAFQAYCDMTLDGAGWQLVAWVRNNSHAWAFSQTWATYRAASALVTPSAPAIPSYIDAMSSALGGQPLNVRLTYSPTTQGTLDVRPGTNTARAYTSTSTWRGELVAVNPLPPSARNTVNHNCTGYQYVDYGGTSSAPARGCYIEFTNGQTGTWAGCGQTAYAAGAGAAWNLCFDNGDGTGSVGNSALAIWHAGGPGYHEIMHVNYGSNNPANGAWGSFGGTWTWSAWVRP